MAIEQADRIFDLIALISDPAQAKARLEELVRAAAHQEAKAHDAAEKTNVLLGARAAQATELARQRDEHLKKIGEERAAFDFECAQREQEIYTRLAEAKRLQAEATETPAA